MKPTLSVVCEEPEGSITRHIYPLMFTPENLVKFYEKSAQFPILFGRPINSIAEFLPYIIDIDDNGVVKVNGAFWVIDDFVGVMYLNGIGDTGALAHITFFDRRFRGRQKLIKGMLRHVFDTYKLHRISVQLPGYVGLSTMKFVSGMGFKLEGKLREAARYKDKDFDILLYGILESELK